MRSPILARAPELTDICGLYGTQMLEADRTALPGTDFELVKMLGRFRHDRDPSESIRH